MRPSTRLLTARLPAFTPTGITGILTHPHPRPTLIALYNHTLSLLRSNFPEHSMYRQSTENLTKHRLSILESVKPANGSKEATLEEVGAYMRYVLNALQEETEMEGMKLHVESEMKHWSQVAWPKSLLDLNPGSSPRDQILPEQTEDQANATTMDRATKDEESTQVKAEPVSTNSVDPPVRPRNTGKMFSELIEDAGRAIVLEEQLTAEQVEEVENRIGEGLIEEVVEQGWNELRCVKAMMDDRVWEPLAEVPVEGQWEQFRTPSSGN